MKRLRLLMVGAGVGAAGSLLMVAPASAEPALQTGVQIDVVPGVIWTVAGIAITCAVGGVLYFFKREVGGFPENPDWVAPISIMRSADLPDEGAYGDVEPGAHGGHH